MLATLEGALVLDGPAAHPSLVARYEALIRVSAALRAYHDRDRLFSSLARELRPVVRFDYLGLALYDEHTNAVERHVLEATGKPLLPPPLSPEASFSHWVIEHQQPLVIPVMADETRFPDAVAYVRSQGLQSSCALPLTTPRHRLGMLFVGSRDSHMYQAADVTFLSLVANQVALAIDDAQNYGALQRALAVERERLRSIEASDDLLRAVASVLDIRQVFPRISEIASTVLPHDRLTFTFHDRDGEIAIQAASDGAPLPARLRMDTPVREGDTFAIIDELDAAACPVIEPPGFGEYLIAAGFRSMMDVRLNASGQLVGLQFWSKHRAAFDEGQVPIARRIADHVALAVSHERLAEIARQAADAKRREERLEARVKSLSDELATKTRRHQVVGPSTEWQSVLKAAVQVAATDSTVFLAGESGTGKEVVARFIHRASKRASGAFVAINCAALPEQLLESELFGYERGAFTGAQQSKAGHIELAAGGVLFLDEVSEMSPSAQAKFLRVLQEREFQRLGGTRPLKADVRVIAATNRDLRKAMERGDFREDLYYRLQVFDIKLPALRDRPADILPLSEMFLQELGQMFGRPPAGLTREAREMLLQHAWPGNVRELRNALERAAILCEGGLITGEHLSLKHRAVADAETGATATSATLQPAPLPVVEREMIVRALADASGNKSRAAARLGISRTQLYVRMRKYQLSGMRT